MNADINAIKYFDVAPVNPLFGLTLFQQEQTI